MFYYSPALKMGVGVGGYIGFGLSAIPSIPSSVFLSILFFCQFVCHNFFVSAQYLQNSFYVIYPNFVCALILT